MWKGKLVLKGLASEEDADIAVKLGIDGLWVSNHGGWQVDTGESAIAPMTRIAKKYKGKVPIIMDSGIRTGPDICSSMAKGADFTFLGRTFMYSCGALGNQGGEHAISMLKTQCQQILEQLCCENPKDLPNHLKTSKD